MTDKDNITLPREVIVQAVKVLSPMAYDTWPRERNEVVATLRAALAAPRLAVTVDPRLTPDEAAAISSALAAPEPEPEKRHPGYIIGNHWFETAYERLCAGEAEDAILEDYELVREPRLRELRRNAERYEWLRGMIYDDRIIVSADTMLYGEALDAAIDAAMQEVPR